MLLPRSAIFAAFAACLTPVAIAQEAENDGDATQIDRLLACRAIESDSARLACQDEALTALAAALEAGTLKVEADSPGTSALAGLGNILRRQPRVEVEPVEEVQEDGSVVVFGTDGQLDEVRGLPVSRVGTTRSGRLVVYLENGQVWRQTGSERVREPRERDMDGLTAEVETGMFGAIYLKLSHQRGRFRVERIE